MSDYDFSAMEYTNDRIAELAKAIDEREKSRRYARKQIYSRRSPARLKAKERKRKRKVRDVIGTMHTRAERLSEVLE